ncbi:protein FAM136A-like [Oppia nitens]|uniref:protein FAM136A-like n=1 Tax=Oppia nitens TaxID=1686743 RepID=UPI0023DCDDB3|nr:protein FAM136A-like [Oppia nitens]
MASEAQTRVQKAFHQLMNDLDKTCMRQIQGQMHRCAAQCCDRTDLSMDANHECISKCSQPLQTAQTYVEQEVTSFQDRMERCVLSCQDQVKDKIGVNTSDDQIKGYTNQFESCVIKCVDTHIDLLPNMMKKMQEYIKKNVKN